MIAAKPGRLLGGRLAYAQPPDGFRTGIEPVLLAAAVPGLAGQRVLEGGTGAGAALLCLGQRVPGLAGTGIERNPDMAALARSNLAANALWDRMQVVTGDVVAQPAPGPFDHALANPPWHDPTGTKSVEPRREQAKRAAPGLLGAWTAALAGVLRPRGSLSLILPAGQLSAALAALSAAGCGAVTVLPLWPGPGRAAKLLLLQARRGAGGPDRLLPGLLLHQADGGYTPEAEAILRDGAALPL